MLRGDASWILNPAFLRVAVGDPILHFGLLRTASPLASPLTPIVSTSPPVLPAPSISRPTCPDRRTTSERRGRPRQTGDRQHKRSERASKRESEEQTAHSEAAAISSLSRRSHSTDPSPLHTDPRTPPQHSRLRHGRSSSSFPSASDKRRRGHGCKRTTGTRRRWWWRAQLAEQQGAMLHRESHSVSFSNLGGRQ